MDQTMAEITQTTWHNMSALNLESDRMRVVIIPDLGAKIVSLYDKAHQYEWLAPPMRPLKPTVYGANFVSQDMSGWDEMIPTINACDYLEARLPDHGEVWSIPWQVEQASEAAVLSVSGVALPYRLTRSARLVDPDCLELDYTLIHTGDQAYPYLYAAHPQFNADEQTRLVLPPEVTHIINVIANDPAWGAVGTQHAWPEAVDRNGRAWRLDRVRSVENNACRKFYILPTEPVAWAALLHEGKCCQLRLEWSPVELPYLGLWIDEGSFNSVPVAAFEPSNAYFDSLLWAIQNERVPVLKPGDVQRWRLTIRLSTAQAAQ
jgi:galactose mutarotase-like enzyme